MHVGASVCPVAELSIGQIVPKIVKDPSNFSQSSVKWNLCIVNATRLIHVPSEGSS